MLGESWSLLLGIGPLGQRTQQDKFTINIAFSTSLSSAPAQWNTSLRLQCETPKNTDQKDVGNLFWRCLKRPKSFVPRIRPNLIGNVTSKRESWETSTSGLHQQIFCMCFRAKHPTYMWKGRLQAFSKVSLILLSPLFSKITFYPRFFVLAFFVGNPRFFEINEVLKNPRFFRLLAPFWKCIRVWTDVDWICKCTVESPLQPISSDKRCSCPCYLCACIWRWHRLKPTFEFLSVALHEN